jgi:hypothetical protein
MYNLADTCGIIFKSKKRRQSNKSAIERSSNFEDKQMETYTIIKKGESIRHCLNIPAEFVDQELEITIKPVKKERRFKKKLALLFEKNKDIDPFKSVIDSAIWQKEQRSDW